MDSEPILFYRWGKQDIHEFTQKYRPSQDPLPVEGVVWYYMTNKHPSRIETIRDDFHVKSEEDNNSGSGSGSDSDSDSDSDSGLEISDDGFLIKTHKGVVVSKKKMSREFVSNCPHFFRVELLILEWDRILRLKRTPITYNLIRRLETLFKIGSGKWLIYEKSDSIDEVWAKICYAIHDGKFPPCCSGAKVSSSSLMDDQLHVICVYNDNWLNQSEVISTERAIRSLGVSGLLNYKPDINTYLDIYKKNPYGIRPSVYKSFLLEPSGFSLITSVFKWDKLPNAILPGPEVPDEEIEGQD